MDAAEDPIVAFQAAMAQHGIVLKGTPVGDGRLHRFDVEGDPKGSKNGYYTLHLDGHPAGVFGCWKRGIKETWKANGAPLSDFDRREADARGRGRAEAARARTGQASEGGRRGRRELWAGYAEAPADHPYLVRKQVAPTAPGSTGRAGLCSPCADADGAIWSLQTID